MKNRIILMLMLTLVSFSPWSAGSVLVLATTNGTFTASDPNACAGSSAGNGDGGGALHLVATDPATNGALEFTTPDVINSLNQPGSLCKLTNLFAALLAPTGSFGPGGAVSYADARRSIHGTFNGGASWHVFKIGGGRFGPIHYLYTFLGNYAGTVNIDGTTHNATGVVQQTAFSETPFLLSVTQLKNVVGTISVKY